MDLRKREELLRKLKNEEEAEQLKKKGDVIESEELFKHDIATAEKIYKVEQVVKKKHKQQMQALLARIQRDRREQLRHRMQDC